MKYFSATTVVSTVIAIALVIAFYHFYKMYAKDDSSSLPSPAETTV